MKIRIYMVHNTEKNDEASREARKKSAQLIEDYLATKGVKATVFDPFAYLYDMLMPWSEKDFGTAYQCAMLARLSCDVMAVATDDLNDDVKHQMLHFISLRRPVVVSHDLYPAAYKMLKETGFADYLIDNKLTETAISVANGSFKRDLLKAI